MHPVEGSVEHDNALAGVGWQGLMTRMGPRVWWKTIREIVTLERMHRAFDCGLMTYGMIKAKKLA